MIYRDFHIELHQDSDRDPESRGRFLIVGDVHGQMDMLMRLMDLAGYDASVDWLIAVGDLVDRGPASAEVLRWVTGGKRRFSLLGNHDAMMLDAEFLSNADLTWMRNGGTWSIGLEELELNLLRRLVSGFPLTARLHLHGGIKIGVVHGEVRPGTTWKQLQRSEYSTGDALDDRSGALISSLLWGRQRYYCSRALKSTSRIEIEKILKPVRGVDLVICGHTIMPTREPLRFGSHLFIDTGAWQTPNGRLTAVDPVAGVYWQVGHEEDQQWGPTPLPAPVNVSLPKKARKGRPPHE
ncbi:metallophosphoesterase [Polycyclovorans algicola]|uniref:metallophosphoesterase n=1 Tax=Polycyclovorans algicola TaxID=616992 RepID=UPI0004A6F918|nr:metallophosphoesterase [Polycyclovorans algicola]